MTGPIVFKQRKHTTIRRQRMRIERDTYYASWRHFTWFRADYNPSEPVDGIDDAIVCHANCLPEIGDWYFLNTGAYLKDATRVPVGDLFFTQKIIIYFILLLAYVYSDRAYIYP
jgi:hypothetical protein